MATSSFEKINYTLRPNKSIERKMMAEAFSRLSFIEHVNNYRYVGFGSAYFADFILFHKHLGITNLLSIEKEESKKARFEFNIPYSGIKMLYGDSTTILPNIELDKIRSIVWLDYDDKISDFMFADTESFFLNAKPGSVFVLSVNIEQDFMEVSDAPMSLKEFRMAKLIERVGKARIPGEFEDMNLTTKNTEALVYEMLNRQIASTLLTRNGNNVEKVSYQQLFNFKYKDNATILTIGGILHTEAQIRHLKRMKFDTLPFIRQGKESYDIQCPNLTFREIKALDKILPDDLEIINGKFTNKQLKSIPLIATDIQNYGKVYRYYPNFADINI